MENGTQQPQGMPEHYDRLMGALHGVPDVTCTRPTTVKSVVPVVGTSQTFIVQTYRQRVGFPGKGGKESFRTDDMIFLDCLTKEGSIRIVLPPAVANAIARQRASLTDMVRSKAAKVEAKKRKDRGELPGFMKK